MLIKTNKNSKKPILSPMVNRPSSRLTRDIHQTLKNTPKKIPERRCVHRRVNNDNSDRRNCTMVVKSITYENDMEYQTRKNRPKSESYVYGLLYAEKILNDKVMIDIPPVTPIKDVHGNERRQRAHKEVKFEYL